MPYISSENVKIKRDLLKKTFPEFKFSVTRDNYSAISVNILSGKLAIEPTYQQVNYFQIAAHFKNEPELRDFLQKVYDIIDSGNETEDVSPDYGTVPRFYTNITIGRWDKPYIQKV